MKCVIARQYLTPLILLSAIRYVHNNPEKAEITKKENYRWSSYPNYMDILNPYTEVPEIKEILEMFSSDIGKALKEFIHYSNQYEDRNFLEMEETIKSGIDEENVNEYIKRYLKSRNLKKEDLKRREHTQQKEDLIRQLTKRSNLSKRKIAILIGVNRETVRRVSEEPSL